MGMLIDGRWKDLDRTAGDGNYHRKPSSFRDHIGSTSRFPATPGRYHLYVSLACPWASRVVIVRALRHLEPLIGMSIVSPDMLENGWPLSPAPDPLTGASYLYQIYAAADPAFTGTATVPILYDTVAGTIVNNESSDLMRDLNHAFDDHAAPSLDLYPAAHAAEIDALNDRIYGSVNNGVYKAGFATTQAAYEKSVLPLFAMLDELDVRLANRRFLFGDAITETDIRLFTTGIRFDTVYFSHFKCNVRQWRDYPNLSRWLAGVYALPGIADTVDLAQIKRHYYFSQRWVNPTGIVPVGPTVDLTGPLC